MKIELINKNYLIKLEPLLSESYGEKISIQDEIEYFEETKPTNWFVSINSDNDLLGFIRSFPFLDNTNVEVELYARNDINIEKSLIQKFDGINENKIVRFCLNMTQKVLISYLKEIGYTYKIEEFKMYVFSKKNDISDNKSIRFGKTSSKEIYEIIDVLSEFNKFSESQIINLIKDNKIVVCEKNNIIVGVSLNNIYENYIEIAEISVKNELRRNGFGKELLEGIIFKYPDKKLKLKVNKENISAIKLYEKVGFEEKIEDNEIWLSKNFHLTC
jgi:ribosomal protein S18 acetylase RimI-like enzyme